MSKRDRTFQFTQQRIEKLPPAPEGKRVDYFDAAFPKLTCRVTSTGAKTFVVLKWTGKTATRITLGRYHDMSVSDARQKAAEALSDLVFNCINPIIII